jgi:hypothetical protein
MIGATVTSGLDPSSYPTHPVAPTTKAITPIDPKSTIILDDLTTTSFSSRETP